MSIPPKQTQEGNSPALKGDLESEKVKLEIKKIQLENNQLSRKFYKNPQWLGFASTIIISIISLIFFFVNGVFDKKYQEYKAQKSILELESLQFSLQVDSLHIQRDSLAKKVQEYTSILGKTSDSLRKLNSDITRYKDDKKSLQLDLNDLVKNISSMNSKLGNAYKNLNYANDSISTLNTTILSLNKQIGNLWDKLDQSKFKEHELKDWIEALQREKSKNN